MLKFSKNFDFNITPESKSIMENAMRSVKEEMDSDRIGYYKLPTLSLAHLETLKSINTENITQIIIVGIGGSSLGAKAIDSILRPYTEKSKEILFLENSDPLTISNMLEKIDRDHALFFIISKSGSTIEVTSILKMLISYCQLDLEGADKQRMVAITDKGSVLSDFAKNHQLHTFYIPDNVGGRFSVLSAVGTVPLAIAGYNMKRLLQGANDMIERFFKGEENHILEKAYYLYEKSQSESINVLFSYADCLEDLTKWYVQLWGESLGKIDPEGRRVGLTPIGLTGAVDQHSFLQLIIEGPKDKNITFISIEDFQKDLMIPNISLHGIEKTDFINGQSFNTLINAQCDATMQSIMQSDIGTDMIKFDKISPENIGAIIVYYELLTSLVGVMFNVNTYDQPGVELGKKILYKNLG